MGASWRGVRGASWQTERGSSLCHTHKWDSYGNSEQCSIFSRQEMSHYSNKITVGIDDNQKSVSGSSFSCEHCFRRNVETWVIVSKWLGRLSAVLTQLLYLPSLLPLQQQSFIGNRQSHQTTPRKSHCYLVNLPLQNVLHCFYQKYL